MEQQTPRLKKLRQKKTKTTGFDRSLLDGLAKQNVVLMTGIVNAPVVIAATTFKKGVVIAIAFAVISMLTIFICSFVPKKIVYTLRVITFALVGSVIYIPTVIMLEEIFPRTVGLIGIYMPLLITNALIFSKTESRFYLRRRGEMMIDVFFFSVGFGVVCALVGALRELITAGSIADIKLAELNVSAFEAPFGGFIMVGIMAGAFRALYNFARNRRINKNSSQSPRGAHKREV